MLVEKDFTPQSTEGQTTPSGWLTATFVGPQSNNNFAVNKQYQIKYYGFWRIDADGVEQPFLGLIAVGDDRREWLFDDQQLDWFRVETDLEARVRAWLRLTARLDERNRLIDEAISTLQQAKAILGEVQGDV